VTFGAFNRPITKQELGRALALSAKYGGEHVAKWESGKSPVSSTAEVALRMMLNGAKPHTMDDIILPGYPRGEVRQCRIGPKKRKVAVEAVADGRSGH
jgi:hypothetical protein